MGKNRVTPYPPQSLCADPSCLFAALQTFIKHCGSTLYLFFFLSLGVGIVFLTFILLSWMSFIMRHYLRMVHEFFFYIIQHIIKSQSLENATVAFNMPTNFKNNSCNLFCRRSLISRCVDLIVCSACRVGGQLPKGATPYPNGTLVLGGPLNSSDEGIYQCVAENKVGKDMAEVEIRLTGR